jgi:hypothetical protein
MQKIVFEILVQTATIVGLFWTLFKFTVRNTVLNYTVYQTK